jgi:hypothetical protein
MYEKENTFNSFLIYFYKIKLFIFPARSNALYVPFSARRRSLQTRFVSIHLKSSSTMNNICITVAQALTHNSKSGIPCICTSGLDIPLWHIRFLIQFRQMQIKHAWRSSISQRPTENYDNYDWRNVRYAEVQASYFAIIMHKLPPVSSTFRLSLAMYQISFTKRLELFLQCNTNCQ